MRLNQYLAAGGLGSRRACEQLIKEGRVVKNGQVVTDLATRVEAEDYIKVDGRTVRAELPLTAMLNKPTGYLCTADDPHARKTVYELLPRSWPRVFTVGRLDLDSEGMLLVTNDGALAQKLAHPRFKLPKTYEVLLDREFNFMLADKLKKGLRIEGQRAWMEQIHRIGPKAVKVVLTQGIKRQIRLMFEILGYKVVKLMRTKIGGLELGDVPKGGWRLLNDKDLRLLQARTKPSGPKTSRPPGKKP
jgi:23S rRNA pseudouridine2605 synthase